MTKLQPLTIATACAALASFAVLVAHAQGRVDATGGAVQTAQVGLGAHSAIAAGGNYGASTSQRGLIADGQGNVEGRGASAFSTASGGQGWRNRRFSRSADGTATASGQAAATGGNGSTAERSGSFTRSADGSATGERSTTLTNANTGVTLDGSTTYSKGSGVSRTATCKDAAGNTVGCGSR